ncbi:MAG TPA: DpnII family type II restriction endonuclease [Anaerolineae bacterium]|nr:DpnII family type II restriction endonuclease [Anaerolineae bacterium]HQK13743.1 DpnII family type II restriction endonuclease [Anaerolineae bacterium]
MTPMPHKLSFEEAWDSITIFFVDDALEQEIDREVDRLLRLAEQYGVTEKSMMGPDSLAALLQEQKEALEFVLREVELSEEKFLRIISLLRQIGRIPVSLDREWTMGQVIRRLQTEPDFASLVSHLLMDGVRDPELQAVIPRYYLEALNFREIATGSVAARRVRYKRALIGTYSGRKGYRVEAQIRGYLERIQERYGIGFEQGQSRFVNVNVDFAIPSLDDPWVILMSSFQETTSSGQSTKARDMETAYEDIRRSNSRHGENRAFVNFADGGGWLARRRDFQRLVENCHYFINLRHLDLLEPIVLAHVPRKYFRKAGH